MHSCYEQRSWLPHSRVEIYMFGIVTMVNLKSRLRGRGQDGQQGNMYSRIWSPSLSSCHPFTPIAIFKKYPFICMHFEKYSMNHLREALTLNIWTFGIMKFKDVFLSTGHNLSNHNLTCFAPSFSIGYIQFMKSTLRTIQWLISPKPFQTHTLNICTSGKWSAKMCYYQ